MAAINNRSVAAAQHEPRDNLTQYTQHLLLLLLLLLLLVLPAACCLLIVESSCLLPARRSRRKIEVSGCCGAQRR